MGYVTRWLAPMTATNQMIDNEQWRCPVCRELFKEGDVIGLLPVQIVPAGKRFGNITSIPVHKHCYLQEEKEE